MSPSQLSQQCCDNSLIRESLREFRHPAQIVLSETRTELPLQLSLPGSIGPSNPDIQFQNARA